MQQLQKSLQRGIDQTKNSLGKDLGQDPFPTAGKGKNGDGQGQGKGKGQPGKGGITRGPGAAPMFFSPDETQLDTNQTEIISNDDVSKATVGDLLSVTSGEHEIDTSKYSPVSGGSLSSKGSWMYG